jgi:hypothetical protein
VDRTSGVDHPAVFPVVAAQTVFHLERGLGGKMPQVGADAAVEIFRMDAGGPAVTELLFKRTAGELEPGPVEVGASGVLVGMPDQGRKALEQREREILRGWILDIGRVGR